MTFPNRRLPGTTAMMALALASAVIVGPAAADGTADLAQLSEAEKLEILNSGDSDAITDLLEAEESAAQAEFARERLEREKKLVEIDGQRAEAAERGAAYWDSFDPESIDLTGFDFAIADVGRSEERRAILNQLPIVTGFERAAEVTYPPSKFDCNPARYAELNELLKISPDLPMPIGRNDVARVLDYLADRAALETGDCSCATQAVPVDEGWLLIERLAQHPSGEAIRGKMAKSSATNSISSMFRRALGDEARQFCARG
jgi:hypothetical protein